MNTLCVILGRAGSKGLPGKNIAMLAGRPLIAHTIELALAAERVDRVVVSTDGPAIAAAARALGVDVVLRPADLASDTATVDSAARHAVAVVEERTAQRFDAVVILYANVPLRPADLIDRAVAKLESSAADSVQSVCPVGKLHPYWMRRLTGPDGDRLEPYQPNQVYRRQDLPPVYQLDGGIIAVRRESLWRIDPQQPHAFLGDDRRAVVTETGSVIDIDDAKDLAVARALLENDSPPSPTLHIGPRVVSAASPVYVIAELGVNHDGSPARALELVRGAKQAGADAVKLQLFDARWLLSAEAELAGYQKDQAQDAFAMLAGLQLSPAQMQDVRKLAHELGMGFIVTCFSLELVSALAALQVDAVKLASPDCVNLPLLDAVLTLGKPVLISTGAALAEELWPAAARLKKHPAGGALLQCVSSYPTADADAALGGIRAMPPGFIGGYSDHTTSLHTGMLAVAAGARIIEKHLTFDRRARGPDHAASLDVEQMREYIDLIRQAQPMLGPSEKRVADCEQDVRRVSRQSVCARRDLAAGQVLRREDLTIKRPGLGLPAAMLPEILGRKLARPVAANHLLREEDLIN
ncbi:MAG: N-acetylneuraminate synthase family protein [Phycisphaeraceae bacterium]|nr:N-acetylneuraminate synthase family protein [Phycisphaeraceae bacterium]